MKNLNLNEWLDCDDEMKMDSFIQHFDDENALRKFAVLNAKSVAAHLVDARSKQAVTVAESYLNGEASDKELDHAYREAESACEEIEAANMSEDDPTRAEEITEYATLVALWAAYPIGHAGVTSLQSAQDAALHTAFYCFQIDGSRALEEQLESFRNAGLAR